VPGTLKQAEKYTVDTKAWSNHPSSAGHLDFQYREWEYLARASNPFCANAPLFVVNNLKLAGLLAVAILGARLA
jgi:hypothetical protein